MLYVISVQVLNTWSTGPIFAGFIKILKDWETEEMEMERMKVLITIISMASGFVMHLKMEEIVLAD